MARKEALRELQARLAERLQAARTEERTRSWLAVECSDHGFLFPLTESGEIFPMSTLMPVPHAHDWFLGVANLRGHLHGVVDLASFLGVKSTEASRDQPSLIALNAALDINCALLVDRLAGLRSEKELTALAAPDGASGAAAPRFVGPRFEDEDGRTWQALNLAELAHDEAFLRIVN